MAFDDFLRFTGTSGAATAVTSASTGTGLGVGQYVGAERLFLARLWVPASGGITAGTTGALNIKFQDSTTLAGTYTDMGYAFPAFTGTTGQTLSIDTTGTVLNDETPLFCEVRTRKDKPFVRIFISTDGTGIRYNGFYVLGVPTDAPAF